MGIEKRFLKKKLIHNLGLWKTPVRFWFFVFVEQGAAQPKKPVCRTTKNE